LQLFFLKKINNNNNNNNNKQNCLFLFLFRFGVTFGAVASVAPFDAPRFVWRLLASLPPVLLSAFVSDLGTVSALAGTCGLTLLFVFPVALQVGSP
jgi:hypothetical protein